MACGKMLPSDDAMPHSLRKLDVSPGIVLWPGCLKPAAQTALIEDVLVRVGEAPFYRPRMPRSGRPFSVEETNFGTLGWYSDEAGYRYETRHPRTQRPWPPMPESLIALWSALTNHPALPAYAAFMRSRSHIAFAGYLGRQYDPFMAQQAAALPIA